MMSTQYDFIFKILLIGDSSVGKSSLLTRFADNTFSDSFLPTIGVDFKIRTIENSGSVIKLQMWDTAGQEKFKTITAAYYKGSHGILLVFDVCDKRSFVDVANWLNEVEKFSSPDVVKILVGNKCDMQGEREVSREEGELFASSMDMKYFETSAKSNRNVENVFKQLAESMKQKFAKAYLDKYKENKHLRLKPCPLVPEKNKQKSCC